MKKLILFLTISASSILTFAQSRAVYVSWTVSTSTGVTGYNLLRADSATPTNFITINSSPITTLNYNDTSALIGHTYLYEIVAISADCTPTTPITQVCGTSAPSSPVSTTVPPTPSSVIITLTVKVQ